MEALFYDDEHRFKGVKKEIPEPLKKNVESFFLDDSQITIENHFFLFGLKFESSHYEKNKLWYNLPSPTKEKFGGAIDSDLIVSIQIGKDLNNEYDEGEADEYDKYYWVISRAIKFNRPDWSFFYFFGNILALLNGERIDPGRFELYLKYFPKQIVEKYNSNLLKLFNHFVESDYQLITVDEEFKLTTI